MDEREPSLDGQTLGQRWRLLRLIGRGGMSAVYEARDIDGARVAVKVLRAPSLLSSRARERFMREGRVADAVTHPGLVRVLAGGQTDDGRPFLVMELLEGRTLRAACEAARAPLEVVWILAIAAGVLDVLSEAHALGIVHRDIKPENVFITSDGQVKVLDFGIAAVREGTFEDASITQSGVALGTPAFMAPEQARGHQAHVDIRTDVWAVGATMFYCLTRRHVHEEATNANEAMIFAATLRAPSLTKFRPELAGPVARIVDRALALEPEARWATARAMHDAVVSETERLASTDESERPIPFPWTAETIDEAQPVRTPGSGRRMTGRLIAAGAILCGILASIFRGERLPPPRPAIAQAVAPSPAPQPSFRPADSVGLTSPAPTTSESPAAPAARPLPHPRKPDDAPTRAAQAFIDRAAAEGATVAPTAAPPVPIESPLDKILDRRK